MLVAALLVCRGPWLDWRGPVSGARSGLRKFRKSSFSSDSFNCVEVATSATEVAVRDSKDPEGPVLSYGVGAWREFIGAIRAGTLRE
jgi:hypothetical protein